MGQPQDGVFGSGREQPASLEVSRGATASGPTPSAYMATSESLAALLGERELNLRQVILRAHRGMNRRIAEKFGERGYPEIRPAHLTLLANMNLGETSLADLAERAQMTTEGVRQLAAELEALGILAAGSSLGGPSPAGFTDAGWELMLTSFNIQREIEAECRARLRDGDLEELRRILGLMFPSSS